LPKNQFKEIKALFLESLKNEFRRLLPRSPRERFALVYEPEARSGGGLFELFKRSLKRDLLFPETDFCFADASIANN
jgi:hypothetical protein